MRRYDKWQRRKYNEGKRAKAAVNKMAEIGGKAMARRAAAEMWEPVGVEEGMHGWYNVRKG